MILVTGASGLLGRAVVADLRAADKPVLAVDRVDATDQLQGIDVDFRVADLRDTNQAFSLIEKAKAVVHLAGWPTPHAANPETVWSDNVQLNANLVAGARRAGVETFIYASSQSVLGLAWSENVVSPDYLPVDEKHPCRPEDLYSMSKLAGEHLTRMLAQVSRTCAMAMRFPVIWNPLKFEEAIANRIQNPQQGAKSQWAYIDLRDAARSIRLAIDGDWPGYECINIAARHCFLPAGDLASAVRQWYPDISSSVPDHASFTAAFSSQKALDLIGFESRYCWNPDGVVDESLTRSSQSGHPGE